MFTNDRPDFDAVRRSGKHLIEDDGDRIRLTTTRYRSITLQGFDSRNLRIRLQSELPGSKRIEEIYTMLEPEDVEALELMIQLYKLRKEKTHE